MLLLPPLWRLWHRFECKAQKLWLQESVCSASAEMRCEARRSRASYPPGLHRWCDVFFAATQVAKASDFGRNDRTFFVRTHLGHLLHAGDNALGYDMSTSNMVNPDLEAAAEKGFTVPDVILVHTPCAA